MITVRGKKNLHSSSRPDHDNRISRSVATFRISLQLKEPLKALDELIARRAVNPGCDNCPGKARASFAPLSKWFVGGSIGPGNPGNPGKLGLGLCWTPAVSTAHRSPGEYRARAFSAGKVPPPRKDQGSSRRVIYRGPR
jgi:hypothetical protein